MSTDLASLIGALGAQGTARGLWLTHIGPDLLELVAHDGPDWFGIDLQHGSYQEADLAPLLRVSRVPTLARVASHDAAHIGRVLDAGVAGVIVPGVESAEQASSIVAAAHVPPRGRRSTGLARHTLNPPADPVVLPMIETAPGLAAAAEIAATAGVDGLFVGPYDLSLSLGLDGPRQALPQITEAVEVAHQRGLLAGVFAGDAALLDDLPHVQLLAVDADVSALRLGLGHLFPEQA